MLRLNKIKKENKSQMKPDCVSYFLTLMFICVFFVSSSDGSHGPIWTFYKNYIGIDGNYYNAIPQSLSYLEDIDDDGIPEVVVGYQLIEAPGINKIGSSVISGATGDVIAENTAFGDKVESIIPVGDIDNDGVPDVLISSSLDDYEGYRRDRIYKSDTLTFLYNINSKTSPSPVVNRLTDEDLNGDGLNEIVTIGFYEETVLAHSLNLSTVPRMLTPEKDKIVHSEQYFEWTNVPMGTLIVTREPWPCQPINECIVYFNWVASSPQLVTSIPQDIEKIYVFLATRDEQTQLFDLQYFEFKTTLAD